MQVVRWLHYASRRLVRELCRQSAPAEAHPRPRRSGAQFFTTCELRAELEQARGLLEAAQARLASGFPHAEVLVLEPPNLLVAVEIPV